MRKAKTIDEMKDWLADRMSAALRVRKHEMDPNEPFARYGLQSIDAVILAMEIEEEIGTVVEPTLLWEHNTVNLCASHLIKVVLDGAA
jgi:acyl carrier protein